MDSNYIINRLKTTPYKFPTVSLIKDRLNNLDATKRHEVVSMLKLELWKARNVDIHEPLQELLLRA